MNMVELVIEIVIFTALIGVIAGQVSNADGNITGASLVMYGLITLVIIAGFIVYLTKKMGMKKGK